MEKQKKIARAIDTIKCLAKEIQNIYTKDIKIVINVDMQRNVTIEVTEKM